MPNRQDSRGRSKTPAFVMIYKWVLKSDAWKSLTPAARVIYIELKAIYDGKNNGYLGLSRRRAAELCRISKDTATRAFAELVEKGFIECVQQGSFNFKLRHAAEWRITEAPCDRTLQPPSKAFMRWRPEQNPVPVHKVNGTNPRSRGSKQGPGLYLVRDGRTAR